MCQIRINICVVSPYTYQYISNSKIFSGLLDNVPLPVGAHGFCLQTLSRENFCKQTCLKQTGSAFVIWGLVIILYTTGD